jgi:hypothetical protein
VSPNSWKQWASGVTFSRVLGGGDEGITAAPEGTHRAADGRVLWVASLHKPKQDAGVDEYEHQSWSA